jgi:pyruvate dehydrogenase E2 component (dihydrolipoamide acetyltransferase)
MEAGTLVEWLKKPGNAVRRGDVVGVVETQKGTIEIVETGVLDSVLVQPGKKVPVGRALASLYSNGAAQEPEPAPPQPPPEVPPSPEQPPPAPPPERPPAPAPEIPPGVPPEIPPSPEQPPVEIPEPEAKGGIRIRMTPAARRRAAEVGLRPSGIRGTGSDCTVSLADVEAVASRGPVATPSQRAPRPGFDPAELRKAIAAAIARSKREVPDYYLTESVDLRRALAWLETRIASGRRPSGFCRRCSS